MKILRTIGILALVAGLVLGGAGSAFAQDGEPELAEVRGVITAVDTEVGTVTILSEEGETVILTITGETEIKKDGVTAAIEDLAKDDEVEALYNPETLEAVKIVAKSPEPAENGGRAGGPPEPGPHSPGKRHGFFGTVTSVAGYDITLTTEEEGWTVTVTLTDTTKYMIPRVTRGPVVGLAEFEDALGESITTIGDRRIAVLATNVVEEPSGVFTGDAVRLMLIPSPGSPPLHRHRVGIVQAFTAGKDGKIRIVDEDGASHEFGVSEDTVYRPEGTLEAAILGGYVTVVTKGDPKKAAPIAKAIVLHKPE